MNQEEKLALLEEVYLSCAIELLEAYLDAVHLIVEGGGDDVE